MEVNPMRVNEIVRGQRAITADMALRLAQVLGTSARFWMNLQKLYEIRLAENKSGETINTLPTLTKGVSEYRKHLRSQQA